MYRTICLFTLLIFFYAGNLSAQDKVLHRIIFIGDAGEINVHQKEVLEFASNTVLSGNTSVFFLGDNIYPRGMGLPGSKDRNSTEAILKSQFEPMLAKGASVYFIPGNHDWDRMGKNGLAKIKEQSAFINTRNNPLLRFIPADGCPGPVEIPINEKLVVIAFDSEWWLFKHNKGNEDCDCTTKEELIEKLEELAGKHQDKMVLLATHHPFQSYGVHGGFFTVRDHLFPLTNVNKNLYIPLPLIGSLYPFLRTSLPNPEDQMHPWYKQMVEEVNEAFAFNRNLINVAGHEHGLQFIKNKHTQIVSGAGAKNTAVKKGKGSLLATEKSGFVIADQLKDNSIKITYFALLNNKVRKIFSQTLPFQKLSELEEAIATSPLLQEDSVLIKANVNLDKGGKNRRRWLGENYRKEWAADTKLPVLKLSQLHGGLTPTQVGGGMQTKSLRLVDPTGKEWVLRNVNKNMELLLPKALRETFAKDLLGDALSGQHPYAALMIPPIAEAAGVPHANPVIGIVAPDKNLGEYAGNFIGNLVLLEEREPAGKSDNTPRMFKNLKKDNDNHVDTDQYFRARLVDLLIGDWDRHEDQWRWAIETDKNGNKRYRPVPRDRDQALHVVDGILPTIVSNPMIMPRFHDFDGEIKKINYFFMAGSVPNVKLLNKYDETSWNKIVNEFVLSMSDSILEAAVNRLPHSSREIRGAQLLEQLKKRRDNIPLAMQTYYRFLNRIVDIQTSDKNEWVQVSTVDDKLKIKINKISKKGKTEQNLFERMFEPSVTKEIRIFIHDGEDRVIIDNTTPIRLRIVGQKDRKTYEVLNTKKPVRIYGKKDDVQISGNTDKVFPRLKNDSINTAYMPTNLYNLRHVLPAIGYNKDDGLMIGASVKLINQGFRKAPYGSVQEFSFIHSFSTSAFQFGFRSEWIRALGKADILIDAKLMAPNNTQNYFGFGNGTTYDRNENPISYYRSRFSLAEIKPQIRWRGTEKSALSIAPFFQYYSYDNDQNNGKLISNPSLVGTYDSLFVDYTKFYTGISVGYVADSRNSKVLPSSGGLFELELRGFKGLNGYSRDFVQATVGATTYQKLDPSGVFVISNRIGGGVTFGKVPFYNALFLGSHDNLMGFRKYRFAGEHMLFNNLQARIRLTRLSNYILPGELGLTGFFDAGKVWARGFNTNTIHTGVGGGLYFFPLDLALIKIQVGHSTEGWYPHISLGLKF